MVAHSSSTDNIISLLNLYWPYDILKMSNVFNGNNNNISDELLKLNGQKKWVWKNNLIFETALRRRVGKIGGARKEIQHTIYEIQTAWKRSLFTVGEGA